MLFEPQAGTARNRPHHTRAIANFSVHETRVLVQLR